MQKLVLFMNNINHSSSQNGFNLYVCIILHNTLDMMYHVRVVIIKIAYLVMLSNVLKLSDICV